MKTRCATPKAARHQVAAAARLAVDAGRRNTPNGLKRNRPVCVATGGSPHQGLRQSKTSRWRCLPLPNHDAIASKLRGAAGNNMRIAPRQRGVLNGSEVRAAAGSNTRTVPQNVASSCSSGSKHDNNPGENLARSGTPISCVREAK